MNAARLLPVILFATSVPAWAAPAAKLAYDAPAGCPSEDDFFAAVAARGADFEADRATPGGGVIVVSISRAENGFAGALQVRDGGAATNKRELRGTSCREVADALAVVTAIELQGVGSAGSESPATPASPPPAPEPAAPPKPVPTPAPLPDDRLQGRTRIFPKRTEIVTVPAGKLRFDLARTLAVSAGAAAGVIPSVTLPLYDISFTGGTFVTTPDGRQRISGPVFRLHVGVLGPGTYNSPDSRTGLWGSIFSVDLCQAPSYDSKGLVLLLCAGYGGGFMQMTTNGVPGATQTMKTSGFGALLFTGEIQVHLAGPFHLSAQLAGGLKLGQLTAERPDGSRIFASSIGMVEGTAGVGIRY